MHGSLGSWILCGGFRIPFTGTGIPDFNSKEDSRILELDCGFQSPGFRISLSKISWIPESDLPYMGLIMYYQNRIMSCRTGSKICTITDIRSPKGTLTMACPSSSLAANSCANFWNALSSPVPASTQRLIFHSWMSTVSRQILQLLCASHHPQRRAWSQWST